jgi:hypothetical protein
VKCNATVAWSVVLLIASVTCADEPSPPPASQIAASKESPGAGFKLIRYSKDPANFNAESQIWLEPLKPEFKRQLLFTYTNRAYPLIDATDSHIAIAQHEYSSDNLLWLFVRQPDGYFRRIDTEIRDAALKQFCMKTHVQKARDDFDHFDCYPTAWLRGGLLVAFIRGDSHTGKFYLKPWYFIYDAEEQKFVFDDFESNKEVFVTEAK